MAEIPVDGRISTGGASGRPLLPRIDRPTIDELTVLSEAEALRRRMDQRNLPVLRWLAIGFSLLGVGLFIAAAFTRSGLAVLARGVAALLPAIYFLVLHRIDPARSGRLSRLALLDPMARGVARNFRTATLGYLALQFLFLVFPRIEGSEPWLYMFPLVLLAIRISVTEGAVLHGFYLVCAFVWTILVNAAAPPATDGTTPPDQAFLPAIVLNVMAWAAGAAATWRFRRQFLAYWRDLRERARDSARMRDELELARRVQLSMLPRGEIAEGWIRVAGTSVPATEVGGDYFDWFRLEGDRVAVVAGDVAGHGLASGLILSGLRSGLILLAPELERPAAVLEKLQRMVRETASHRMFVTLAILLLDRAGGRAVLASAGHPPVLRRVAANGEVELLPAASLPLGARLRESAREISVPMMAGDLFVLYTDGAYEAAGRDGEPFGFDRLSRVVASTTPEASPREVCDAILSAVRDWSAPAGAGDDVTVVAVRVAGNEP
ncbi:MAG TPA: PP2C family protein-serine/threonine phosphatase [Thermoanaerobaculia bacterium]